MHIYTLLLFSLCFLYIPFILRNTVNERGTKFLNKGELGFKPEGGGSRSGCFSRIRILVSGFRQSSDTDTALQGPRSKIDQISANGFFMEVIIIE